jgi:hypothetical protein
LDSSVSALVVPGFKRGNVAPVPGSRNAGDGDGIG